MVKLSGIRVLMHRVKLTINALESRFGTFWLPRSGSVNKCGSKSLKDNVTLVLRQFRPTVLTSYDSSDLRQLVSRTFYFVDLTYSGTVDKVDM